MQKLFNRNELKTTADTARRDEINRRLRSAADSSVDRLLAELKTTFGGLSEELAESSRERYGNNRVTHGKKASLFRRILGAFINPFTAILFALAVVSVFTDIIWASPGEAKPMKLDETFGDRFTEEMLDGYYAAAEDAAEKL